MPPSPALDLPPGYGFRRLPPAELLERDSLLDALHIWERPRTRGERRYVLGVDVADGIGQDRSVVEVLRAATIEEPAEEVAQYATDRVPPSEFAYLVDAIGHLYKDADGIEAMAAIECNNHGLSVQDTLQRYLHYGPFYHWEYYNIADQSRRFSNKIGWYTTRDTRPILLDKFYSAVTHLDPVFGHPDLIINSPLTLAELADFHTETSLAEAAAARGAHDDCIMALAIAYYTSYRMQAGVGEPISERRRRYLEAQAIEQRAHHEPRDWRNAAFTAEEMAAGDLEEDLSLADHRFYGTFGVD